MWAFSGHIETRAAHSDQILCEDWYELGKDAAPAEQFDFAFGTNAHEQFIIDQQHTELDIKVSLGFKWSWLISGGTFFLHLVKINFSEVSCLESQSHFFHIFTEHFDFAFGTNAHEEFIIDQQHTELDIKMSLGIKWSWLISGGIFFLHLVKINFSEVSCLESQSHSLSSGRQNKF